ncbi:hypothetical protein ACE1MK_09165 [Tenacibaculum maritimum]|uniref:ATP-binding protein n=1 Tax=Tenacibaculum maritimum TaxID=107401 RepID=UPI0012E6C18E|nr:ATP-binding protein [Tenacibaculum maritimum]CAA0160308.1 conserved hypothetical protein [Tenacibaculum maritimum]CAA0237161.1 conserved hypothetical protein [Tenacibaculum maritimum]
MKFTNDTFIKGEGVYYPQILKDIRKSTNPLQPIFEVFTNSIESIQLKKENNTNNEIVISHYLNKNLLSELEFDKIIIEDTGKGFDDIEFKRFLTFKDSRKGFNNKGSGRIQLVHSFEKIEYVSVFKDRDKFKQRDFKISKSTNFIDANNTITFLKNTKEIEDTGFLNTGTTLLLSNLLEEKDKKYFNFLVEELKKELINHYMLFFCLNRENLPKITIKQYVNNKFKREVKITEEDIPKIDKTINFKVNYNWLSTDAKEVKVLDEIENFKITAFKIPKKSLPENNIKLTSKEEIVELSNKNNINLTCLSGKDKLEGNRFLFLISSNYLDDRDSDVRGEFKIPRKEDFQKNIGLFSPKEIFLEDVEYEANNSIISEYKDIQKKTEEKYNRIEELKSMFLLNDDVLKDISISLNDTEESILEKVYVAESKQVAKMDGQIKHQIEQLDDLDPTSKSYNDEFDDYVTRLVKEIPLQNRKALTKYVARRKLVLDLFDKIQKKKLKIQNDGSRKKEESLIHNLIFKQHSNKTDVSDLWLLEEDFILFEGSSEYKLEDIEINGNKVFKSDKELTSTEIEFRDSLNEKRYEKRPDVLMFPDEGKCVIIEFKAPNVNVSDYINQIQNYATLIRNFSKDEFHLDTFYGYLFGEKINVMDVIFKDPDFKEAKKFDYIFRPSKIVSGMLSGRDNGSLYMEIMKYSTLYERAKNRNDVFIKKLTQNFDYDDEYNEEEHPF